MKNSKNSYHLKLAASQHYKERKYWEDKLVSNPVKSIFYYDKKKMEGTLSQFDTCEFSITGDLFTRILNLCKDNDYTLFIILDAALSHILHRYSGNTIDDVIIGTSIFSKTSGEEMVNSTLALLNKINDSLGIKEFLIQTRQTVIEAIENQNFPFPILLELLNFEIHDDEYPLFDVALILENLQSKELLQDIPYRVLFSFLRTNDHLRCTVKYDNRLYYPNTIERIIEHVLFWFDTTTKDLNQKLSDISILPPREIERLVYQFNSLEIDFPKESLIHSLFEEQVQKTPDYIAIIGPLRADGYSSTSNFSDVQITYRELNEKANCVMRRLRNKGINPGNIVAIVIDPSIEMIIGLIGILKSRCAYLPIAPEWPPDRIDYIIKDSNTPIIVDEQFIRQAIHEEMLPSTNEAAFYPEIKTELGRTGAHSLAYVIFTSGSTGKPKGVLVEHINVIANINAFYNQFSISSHDTIIHLSDYTFDAFAEELYPVLLRGGKMVIPGPDAYLDILLLGEYINRFDIDIIDCSPLLLNELNKLSSIKPVRIVISGGDVLREKYIDHLSKIGNVYNTYGPTETTICAAYYPYIPSAEESLRPSIPIGKPIANYKVFIFDESLSLVPTGVVGEICISGPGVTRGYLNRPELTAERFVFFPHELLQLTRTTSTNGITNPIYKTGDLGRWLADGNIEYIGRKDFQVKIRGFRIETGEIEALLINSGMVQNVVVDTRIGKDGEKYLCVYYIDNSGIPGKVESDSHSLKSYLTGKLPAYMIPAMFMKMESFPISSSGKINRQALPEPVINVSVEFVEPRNDIEHRIAIIWKDILEIERIGINDNFFELGGHSLSGIQAINRIQQEFNIKLPFTDIFDRPTINQLADLINRIEKNTRQTIEIAEEREYYKASSSQKRLYILQQMAPETTVYNMPYVFTIDSHLNSNRVEEIFKQLIDRHDSLRTFFISIDNQPIQRVSPHVPFSVEICKATPSQAQIEMDSFLRPFDLSKAPLIRVKMLEILSDGIVYHNLLLDMHHIITDGISQELLHKEFISLLKGEELLPLKIQYKDYSEWQNNPTTKEYLNRQKEYWLSQFQDESPVLNLPTDFPRPPIRSFEGEAASFILEIEDALRFKKLARELNATLYILSLGVFNIFLSKLSSQEDIVVGTPVAGRNFPELENIIGMFVNTLALRNTVSHNLTFINFIENLKRLSLEAFQNQEYPFEELVESVILKREIGRNPLFDTMFALQNEKEQESRAHATSSLDLKPREDVSRFDLTWIGIETPGGLRFMIEYCTRLFKKQTIQRYIQYFKNIIKTVSDNPRILISQIPIITPQEREQILFEFNRHEEPLRTSYKTLTSLFQEQVERTPDHIALSELPIQLTFRHLDKEAQRFSRYLIKKGIRPRDLVAISIHRSIEMIIGVLGILKAGCTYVPINPKNPENRVKFLMEDSGARMLVDTRSFEEANQQSEEDAIIENDFSSSSVDDFAYVLYTSGSTGNPKGVPITHANLFPLLYWGYTNLRFDFTNRTIQTPSFFFDWSVWEIFLTLSSGASLHMINEDILLNPANMIQFIYKHHITILHVTPTQCRYLVDLKQPLTPLRYLFMGGEKLSVTLVRELFELVNSRCRVFNQYGATEATIISTSIELDRNDYSKYGNLSGIPIGWTITQTQLYIFDKSMNLSPVNIPGELYIGGEGISRGYLNNPELTSERFIFSSHHLHQLIPTTNTITNTIYKTGDLAKWLEDGQIEFLGRIDFQVKIRGYRIETGEIENFLLGYKNIKDAVVIALDDEANREKFLCAYIVSYEGEVSIKELREHLSKNMPQYMIPQAFVQLESIPLNPNGKADLKQLPRPQLKAKEGFIPPANEIEEKMIEIWASVLGIEKEAISMDDNFFLIGGHSLKATMLLTRIHKVFNVEIAIAEIFKKPTPIELCTYITLERWDFNTTASTGSEIEEIIL